MHFPKWCLLFLVLPLTLVAVRADDYKEEDIGDYAYDEDIVDQGDLSTSENSLTDEDKDTVGRWYGSRKISFMAYLSKNQVSMTRGLHIRFNRVLLNDGRAYNSRTGVFRAPVNGVYQFTLVIAQRYRREVSANLMVNGRYIDGAVAEGRHFFHDVQDSNNAIVYVKKGQLVYVQIQKGRSLEGDTLYHRYTTFSGHIVYVRR